MQTEHGVENYLPSNPSKKQRVADEIDVLWKEAGPLYIDLCAHKNTGSRGAEIKAFRPPPTGGLCQAQVDGCQVGDVLIGLNQLTNAKEVEVMPFMKIIGHIKNTKWPLRLRFRRHAQNKKQGGAVRKYAKKSPLQAGQRKATTPDGKSDRKPTEKFAEVARADPNIILEIVNRLNRVQQNQNDIFNRMVRFGSRLENPTPHIAVAASCALLLWSCRHVFRRHRLIACSPLPPHPPLPPLHFPSLISP
jgi:hypothetical protein